MQTFSQQAIKTLVPKEVYTDRQEFLEYFYNYALNAVGRRSMSTVLLGQRRMGKTEIFKRVFNRLFFEQDHTDPMAVVPVFYTFQDTGMEELQFALNYVENFLRWYVAFRKRDVYFLTEPSDRREFLSWIEREFPISTGFAIAIDLMHGLMNNGVTVPAKRAVMLPRTVSDRDDSTIVVFLDEFQNTRLPNDKFNIVGCFHESVESPTCPHFVTGSAMSILAKEILGRGSLFGRFRSHPIEPLTMYWGTELAIRAARHYHAELPELVAPIVAERCGSNPFYITAIIQQAAEQNIALTDEETVNNILAVDLSSGFIWAELNDQVTRWIERINEYGITKWVLYLSALEEGERIEPAHIQQQLEAKEGTTVSLDIIRDVLIRLSRGDLLEYMELGGWFRKIDDPILLDFLKAWGKFEVEGQSAASVLQDTVKRYDRLQRRINDQKGYLAEVYLSQILWNGQRKTFPGRYFHADHEVTLPDLFYVIKQRLRLDAAGEHEVDVYAFASRQYWICESKWWETKKVGPDVVTQFVALADKVKEFEGREYFEGERPFEITLWLFAHNGVTPEAEKLLCQHNIYWSTRTELDALIQEVGLRRLPNMS